MKMRECAFSSAALEKVENERRVGDGSLQVPPGSKVVLQSLEANAIGAEELFQHLRARASFDAVT